jgi:NhaP-type Na+/H+ or K+/H+ antiporter
MSDEVLSILYLFVGLAYGVCLTYVLSRSGWEIDYTVILFITGILTAITTKQVRENVKGYEEALFNSILLWETISPELIVFIFLPVLVFGESQSLKLHTVNKVILSSLFLSLLGAAFTAYMIAIICKQVLSTGWSLTLCWLVGCVLCPIDPIAVVVILKATHQ